MAKPRPSLPTRRQLESDAKVTAGQWYFDGVTGPHGRLTELLGQIHRPTLVGIRENCDALQSAAWHLNRAVELVQEVADHEAPQRERFMRREVRR